MKATEVGAVMVGRVVTADYGTPFKEVVRRLDAHGISGLPVIDEDDKVIGVVSETDLMLKQSRPDPHADRDTWAWLRRLSPGIRRATAKGRARTAGGVMSAPAVTVYADATLPEAARLMTRHRVDRLPVVDEEDRLVGIVTRRDLLQVFLRADDAIRRDVEQGIFVKTLWLAPHTVEADVRDGVVTLTGQLERRGDIPVALVMTRRTDGVVEVVDHLSYRFDDRRLQPTGQALHGATDDSLPRL